MNRPKKAKRYADGTTVEVSTTRTELEKLLESHGATHVQVTRDSTTKQAIVIFRIAERYIRLEINVDSRDIPRPTDESYRCKDPKVKFPHGWGAWTENRRKGWVEAVIVQREREAWRRLLLITKGKLELVADSESSIEREFLADIMLPDGSTVHQQLGPRLAESYSTGEMPRLLPGRAE